MKKFVLVILFLVSFNAYSQAVDDCLSNLSIFAEYYKVKNYDSAYEPWMQVRKQCPKMNVAIYTYGKRMLENFIKESQKKGSDGAAEAKKYKDDLITLYDEWLINFPSYKGRRIVGEIISNKAQAMVDYKLASNQEIYNVFDKAYNEDRSSFDDPKPLYNYFKVYFQMYKDGGVTMENIFDKYEEISRMKIKNWEFL